MLVNMTVFSKNTLLRHQAYRLVHVKHDDAKNVNAFDNSESTGRGASTFATRVRAFGSLLPISVAFVLGVLTKSS